jgi:hypothetical protein
MRVFKENPAPASFLSIIEIQKRKRENPPPTEPNILIDPSQHQLAPQNQSV